MLSTSLVRDEIKSIRARRRGSVVGGMLIGGLIGAGIFGIVKYATYTPPTGWSFGPNSPQAAFNEGAVIGFILGLPIGAGIGSNSFKTFKIDGNQEKYELFLQQVRSTK